MPLDQVAHASMARDWAMLKQLMAQRGQSLTVYVALKAIAGVDEGLKASNAAASWAQCGFVPGRRLNRDKLFVDRKEELFRSLRDAPGDAQEQPRKPSLALSLLATVLPEEVPHLPKLAADSHEVLPIMQQTQRGFRSAEGGVVSFWA